MSDITKRGSMDKTEKKKSGRDGVIALVSILAGVLIDYLLRQTGIDFSSAVEPMIIPAASSVVAFISFYANRWLNVWRV